MTINQYLDLAYSVVVDDRVRRGARLYDALDETREFAAGRGVIPVATAGGNQSDLARPNTMPEPEPQTANIGGPGAPITAEDRANAAAMATLNAAMAGVQGGFG